MVTKLEKLTLAGHRLGKARCEWWGCSDYVSDKEIVGLSIELCDAEEEWIRVQNEQ